MSFSSMTKLRFAATGLILVPLLLSASPTHAQQAELQLRGPMEGRDTPRIRESSEESAVPRKSRDFRANGVLYRVKSNESGAERYALMDGEGSIIAFLAPSSRHDLQSFVGSEIGIEARTFGRNDDVAPYVIVERVSLQKNTIADDQVALASYEESQPTAVASEPSWRMASNPRVASNPSGGCHACGDPSHSASFHNGGVVAGPAGGVVTGPSGGVMMGEPIYGEPIYDSGPVSGPIYDGYPGDSCGMGDCLANTSCTTCGVGMPCCCPPMCGPPGWLFLRGESLLWFTDGMDIPELVTTSPAGTAAGDAGVLGQSGTSVLYGDEDILSGGRSGFRILFGGFFGPRRKLGWEAEYFDAGDTDENFSASGDGNGNPIIARPFLNLNLASEDSELVSFPGILTGTVNVDSYSRFNGAAGRFRWNKVCKTKCDPCGSFGLFGCCGYPPFCKIDLTAGYRHYGLNEGIRISEYLRTVGGEPATIDLFDSFETRNDFHGGEIGTSYMAGRSRWTIEMLMRLAIGATRQQVSINGGTTISPLVAPAQDFEGGLLALPGANIGEYDRSRFSMIPELAVNLGFYLSPRMRFMVGYNVIYWSNVARPGEHINPIVNTDLIPPAANTTAAAFPRFRWDDSDFWAQGLNLGLDYRW